MAQGGDPKGTGEGGSSLPDLKAEFTTMPFLRGTVAAARADAKDSANSQFFIMFAPTIALEGNYTAWGRVVSGMDGVDKIAVGEPPPSRPRSCGPISASGPSNAKARACASTCSISSFPPSGSHCGRRGRATARGCSRCAAASISDQPMLDLPGLLRPGDVLVFNDTKVIPAQLEGRRGEASIGATLHKREGPREWRAFLRNAKRVRAGDTIAFGEGVARRWSRSRATARRCSISTGRSRSSCCSSAPGGCRCRPISPAKRPTDDADRADYQTMFAREEGAVAAPTAALHFTPRLLDALEARGDRPRDADLACRRGHLPAGQGGDTTTIRCMPNGAGSTPRPRTA